MNEKYNLIIPPSECLWGQIKQHLTDVETETAQLYLQSGAELHNGYKMDYAGWNRLQEFRLYMIKKYWHRIYLEKNSFNLIVYSIPAP